MTSRVQTWLARRSPASARECTLCGWTGKRFLPFGKGSKRRLDAQCPACGSVERHRLAHFLLRQRLKDGQRTLHLAPERAVEGWLRSLSDEYVSGDLASGKAMRVLDITALDVPDDAFTLVYCSHVLEHVPDDAAAMREMRRVLANGGTAVVLVPIRPGATDEDATVDDPGARLERFGQADHVRFYGLDIVDRLHAAGFEVETLDVRDISHDDVTRHALSYRTTQQVFVCR